MEPQSNTTNPPASSSRGGSSSNEGSRQRRAHKRSRTGCLVCRQRHKRCDEIFVDGACERCRLSGFDCVPIAPGRRYTYSQRIINVPASPKSESVVPKPQRKDIRPPLPTQPPGDSPSVNVWDSAIPTLPAGPPMPSSDLFDFITSLFTPMFPSANDQNHDTSLPNDPNVAPSPDASNFYPPFVVNPNETDPLKTANVFDDPIFYLPPFDMGVGTATSASIPFVPSLMPGQIQISSPVPYLPQSRDVPPALRGDSDLSSAYLIALRSTYRQSPNATGSVDDWKETHIPHLNDTVRGADITNRYRKYQQSWYRKAPERSSRFKRPRTDTPPEQQDGSPLQATSRGAVLEALRARAEGHTNSTDAGSVYYNFALSLLGEPGKFTLSDTLHSVCDLQTYNFLIAGSAASYGALRVGEAVVLATMGPQPVLDLVDLVERNDMALVVFAQADLGHCLCSTARMPIFTLSSSNVLEVYQQFCDVIDDITYAVPLPLHDILHHVCILSPLSADPTTLASLEQSIRDLFDDPDVSFVWSRASLIILYQRLHKVAALHPVIRTMSWDILLALDPRPCLKAEVFPLFLAGTTALLPSQRDAVRLRWVCAPEKGFEESLGFLNDLWAEMDCTGNTIDWLGYMEQRKIKLAFF